MFVHCMVPSLIVDATVVGQSGSFAPEIPATPLIAVTTSTFPFGSRIALLITKSVFGSQHPRLNIAGASVGAGSPQEDGLIVENGSAESHFCISTDAPSEKYIMSPMALMNPSFAVVFGMTDVMVVSVNCAMRWLESNRAMTLPLKFRKL